MNRENIEKALYNAVDSAPGLSFDTLAALSFVKLQEQDYITRQAEVKTPGIIRRISFAGALCLFIAVLISGLYIQKNVSSIITLDVNPSIEIKTNLMNKVLSVKAINKDAEEILGNKDYKGTKLKTLVPLLMNTLVEHKYISTDKSAILLTVANRNAKRAETIRNEVDAAIRESLTPLNIVPTIMSQKLPKGSRRSELAVRYSLSEGKLRLIQDIMTANSALTLENLADKSISRLIDIARENGVDLSKYNIREEDISSGNNTGSSQGNNSENTGNSTGNNSGKNIGEDSEEGKEPAEDTGLKEPDTENNESGDEDRSIKNQDNKGEDDKGKTSDKKNKTKDHAAAIDNEDEYAGSTGDKDGTGEIGQGDEDSRGEDIGQDNEDGQGQDIGQDNEDGQGEDSIRQSDEDSQSQDNEYGSNDISEGFNEDYYETQNDYGSYISNQNDDENINNNDSWNTKEDNQGNED